MSHLVSHSFKLSVEKIYRRVLLIVIQLPQTQLPQCLNSTHSQLDCPEPEANCREEDIEVWPTSPHLAPTPLPCWEEQFRTCRLPWSWSNSWQSLPCLLWTDKLGLTKTFCWQANWKWIIVIRSEVTVAVFSTKQSYEKVEKACGYQTLWFSFLYSCHINSRLVSSLSPLTSKL